MSQQFKLVNIPQGHVWHLILANFINIWHD